MVCGRCSWYVGNRCKAVSTIKHQPTCDEFQSSIRARYSVSHENNSHSAAYLAPELYVASSIEQIAYSESKTLNRSIRTTHISRKTRIKNQPPMKRESAMNDQEKLRCLWNIFETSDDEDERISASRMILSLSAAEDTYIDSPINEAA